MQRHIIFNLQLPCGGDLVAAAQISLTLPDAQDGFESEQIQTMALSALAFGNHDLRQAWHALYARCIERWPPQSGQHTCAHCFRPRGNTDEYCPHCDTTDTPF